MKFIFNYLKKIIAPPFCYYCRDFLQDYTVLCQSCSDLIKPVISCNINITQNNKLSVYAISDYKDPIKPLILAKKWSEYTACKQIAQLIWDYSVLKNIDFDYLVPIPLHWTRYARRGYNQAQVIAQELSRLSNRPVICCIKRSRKTLYQFLLSRHQRAENVTNVFDVVNIKNKELENKKIMLVDDLMTTGSTLKFASKALLKLKPQSIQAIVACRVLPN